LSAQSIFSSMTTRAIMAACKSQHQEIKKVATTKGDPELLRLITSPAVCEVFRNAIKYILSDYPYVLQLKTNSYILVNKILKGYYYTYGTTPRINGQPVGERLAKLSKALIGSICSNFTGHKQFDKTTEFCHRYNEFIDEVNRLVVPSREDSLNGVIEELLLLHLYNRGVFFNCKKQYLEMQLVLMEKLRIAQLEYPGDGLMDKLNKHGFSPNLD